MKKIFSMVLTLALFFGISNAVSANVVHQASLEVKNTTIVQGSTWNENDNFVRAWGRLQNGPVSMNPFVEITNLPNAMVRVVGSVDTNTLGQQNVHYLVNNGTGWSNHQVATITVEPRVNVRPIITTSVNGVVNNEGIVTIEATNLDTTREITVQLNNAGSPHVIRRFDVSNFNEYKQTFKISELASGALRDGNLNIRTTGISDENTTNFTNNFNVVADVTAPNLRVNENTTIGSVEHNVFSNVSFLLSDNHNISEVEVNGRVFPMSPNRHGNLNFGSWIGYIEGENTVILRDQAGNVDTFTFVLDTTAPNVSITDGQNNIIESGSSLNYAQLQQQGTNANNRLFINTENNVQYFINGNLIGSTGPRINLNHWARNHVGNFTVEVRDLAGNTTTVNFELTDKSVLNQTIDHALSFKNAGNLFTSESWRQVQIRLMVAMLANNQVNSTQATIDQANDSLQRGIDRLVLNGGFIPRPNPSTHVLNWSQLNETIELALERLEFRSWYTVESRLQVEKRLLVALITQNSASSVTQANIDEAANSLQRGIDRLELIELDINDVNTNTPMLSGIDRAILRNLVREASRLESQSHLYTEASFLQFTNVLAFSRNILSNTNSQFAIDTTANLLQLSINNLVFVDFDWNVEMPNVDIVYPDINDIKPATPEIGLANGINLKNIEIELGSTFNPSDVFISAFLNNERVAFDYLTVTHNVNTNMTGEYTVTFIMITSSQQGSLLPQMIVETATVSVIDGDLSNVDVIETPGVNGPRVILSDLVNEARTRITENAGLYTQASIDAVREAITMAEAALAGNNTRSLQNEMPTIEGATLALRLALDNLEPLNYEGETPEIDVTGDLDELETVTPTVPGNNGNTETPGTDGPAVGGGSDSASNGNNNSNMSQTGALYAAGACAMVVVGLAGVSLKRRNEK